MASSYAAQMRVHRPQVDAKADGHLPIAHRILQQAQQCQGDPSLSGWYCRATSPDSSMRRPRRPMSCDP
jgi:hypothetical protein